MKRVLHINYDFILGGVEALIMSTYRNIDRNKLQFDFIIAGSRPVHFKEEIDSLGGKIYYIRKKGGFINNLIFMFKLYKFLKQHNYYAIQTHFADTGGFDCLAAYLAGVKKRYTISHGSKPLRFWKRPLSRYLMGKFATKRLAVSSKAGKALYGSYPYEVIKNGIDCKKFSFNAEQRAAGRERLNLKDKFVIGNISRFSKEKNQMFLLDIFSSIYNRNKSAVLLFAGSGKTEQTVKDKVKEKGLEDSVLFLGEQADCSYLYQVMDCFVFPSKTEGFGIVAIEAQSSGLYCFVSDGVPDEAVICNTAKIPLSKTADEWADIILKKTNNFDRKDCSDIIIKAGYDTKDTSKALQKEYLK